MRLVVIEDDGEIGRALERTLRAAGHEARLAPTGLAGLALVVEDPPDAVVLDLGLPDVDGFEVMKMLRAVSSVPVLVATARDDDLDVVRTLDAGADDYIVKPFSTETLEARLRAILRRAAPRREEVLAVGGLRVDVAGRTATLDGEPLRLSRKEFELLAYLAARKDVVVGKRELAKEIWGEPYGSAEKTVDVHLSWLRRKLGETAAEPRFVRAVRGVGVKLVDPGR